MALPILPTPTAVLTQDDKPHRIWYSYFSALDRAARYPVTTISSTANTVIQNTGVTVLDSPSTHTLALPTAGCRKTIIVTSTSTTARIASASTATQIVPGTGWRLVFGSSAANKVVELVGLSTSKWLIASNPGSVTVST